MSTRIGPAYVVHEELMSVGGQMTPDSAMAEMIRQQLQTIGIDADVKEAERGLAFTTRKGTGHLSISKCLKLRRDENTFAAPSAGEMRFQERRALQGALGAPGPLGGNQPRGARHPDPQHRAHEIVNQGIGLHGISAWRTGRQDFASCIKRIKALAFKRCPVPFLCALRSPVRSVTMRVGGRLSR
jgi:hypothetical protein